MKLINAKSTDEKIEWLYANEVNWAISSFFDQGYVVKLGDEINGFREVGHFSRYQAAVDWLYCSVSKTAMDETKTENFHPSTFLLPAITYSGIIKNASRCVLKPTPLSVVQHVERNLLDPIIEQARRNLYGFADQIFQEVVRTKPGADSGNQ